MSSQKTIKRKADKVAIVGFAPSWKDAPFDSQESEYEIWGLNELYKLIAQVPKGRADRWFEIHSRHSPSKNTKEHVEWLQKAPVPVYMWEHYDDIPNSVPFPKDDIIKFLQKRGFQGARYFTNSISWMIAFAIFEGFKEIHVYGVDMAQSSEYQFQKPSCEYILGIAEGMGIKVYIPSNSDLLKTGMLYGFESDNQMRVKMKNRIKELKERSKQLQQQKQQHLQAVQQCDAALNQIAGALEDTNFYLSNWIY